MKTKTFTSEEVGKWLATLNNLSTVEEYRTVLHTVRCLFNAAEDEAFWKEVCEVAVREQNNK